MSDFKLIGGVLIAAGALCAGYASYQGSGGETINVFAILLVCAGVFLWRKKPDDSSHE